MFQSTQNKTENTETVREPDHDISEMIERTELVNM